MCVIKSIPYFEHSPSGEVAIYIGSNINSTLPLMKDTFIGEITHVVLDQELDLRDQYMGRRFYEDML